MHVIVVDDFVKGVNGSSVDVISTLSSAGPRYLDIVSVSLVRDGNHCGSFLPGPGASRLGGCYAVRSVLHWHVTLGGTCCTGPSSHPAGVPSLK